MFAVQLPDDTSKPLIVSVDKIQVECLRNRYGDCFVTLSEGLGPDVFNTAVVKLKEEIQKQIKDELEAEQKLRVQGKSKKARQKTKEVGQLFLRIPTPMIVRGIGFKPYAVYESCVLWMADQNKCPHDLIAMSSARVILLNSQRGSILLSFPPEKPGETKQWEVKLPGGYCDRGELTIEAARRELREELGLDIEEESFTLVAQSETKVPRESGKDSKTDFCNFFIILYNGPTPEPLDKKEVGAVRWIPIAELQRKEETINIEIDKKNHSLLYKEPMRVLLQGIFPSERQSQLQPHFGRNKSGEAFSVTSFYENNVQSFMEKCYPPAKALPIETPATETLSEKMQGLELAQRSAMGSTERQE